MDLLSDIDKFILGSTVKKAEAPTEVSTDLTGAVGAEKDKDAKKTAPQNTNNKSDVAAKADPDYPGKPIDELTEVTRSYTIGGQDDPGTSSPANVDKVAALLQIGKALLSGKTPVAAKPAATEKTATEKTATEKTAEEKRAFELGEQLGEKYLEKQAYEQGKAFAEQLLKQAEEEAPVEEPVVDPEAEMANIAAEGEGDADNVADFLGGVVGGEEPAVTADAAPADAGLEGAAGDPEMEQIAQLAEELIASGEVTPEELAAFIEESAGEGGASAEDELAGELVDQGVSPEEVTALGEQDAEVVPEVTPEDVKAASATLQAIRNRKAGVKKMATALKQAVEKRKSQTKG